MTTNKIHAIEVEHLTVSYQARPALLDVSIKIEKDQLIGVIGSNGSGKSTFIKAVLGFDKPDIGTVDYLDEKLGSLVADPHGKEIPIVEGNAK